MIISNTPPFPRGWVWARLRDICNVTDRDHRTPKYLDKGIPLISPTNFSLSSINFDSVKYVGAEELDNFRRKCSPKIGDILYSRIGTIGEARLVNFGGDFVALHSIAMIKPDYQITNSKFVMCLLNSWSVKYQAFANIKSVGTPDLGLERIKNFRIPLPPLPEQHRIIAKIEELLTKLDAGIEALKKIQLQLGRYRQSVLKSAFSGELTAEWRKAHKGELEPASALLEKIKDERKMSSKYKELPPLDTSDLPKLPKGWVWTTIHYLAENHKHAIKAGPFGSSLKKEYYTPSGYKIYGQEQVIRGDSSYGDYYIDGERFEKLKSCAVKPYDVLISLVGTIGKVLVLPETIEPGIINPRLVKLSLEKNLVNNIYIKAYIESFAARQFFSLASHGGTMDILNLSILKTLPIPLPSTNEQRRIIEGIDRCFSITDEIEKTIEQSLKQADRLRQSILKRAFEGKLVPQNPDDEPAEKLLERIKAEKAKQQVSSITSRANNKRNLVHRRLV